jgi:hypothetical protein
MKQLLVGLDFDKTIAHHEESNPKAIKDMDVFPNLKERVLNWIENGHKIYLHTARAKDESEIGKLRKWLDANGLQGIKKITNKKIPGTDLYIGDGHINVTPNTGEMERDPLTRDVQSEIRAIKERH